MNFRMLPTKLFKKHSLVLGKKIFFVALVLSFTTQCNYPEQNQEIFSVDTLIYQSNSYSIFSHSVIDSIYGGRENPAIIPNANSIYSPVRIVPNGKTVVLETSNWWHSVKQISNYPSLKTNHPTVDAIYNLALDNLYRCSSGEFMRNEGEEEMWQAGFRTGEGYGVWTRDACYIALYMGSFIDPAVAKKTLEYVTLNGIDNGEDGLALPAIAVWNHFLVTGDSSIIRDTYSNLRSKIKNIKFNQEKKLGFAHSGSFIDSGPQPEAGGFPLSTNILYMEAYRVMALMGKLMDEPSEQIYLWETRCKVMKETINREYWNEEAGFYTFGPRGSESYKKQHWENLGQSLAIWPKWNIADHIKRKSVLNNKNVAYNQYGFTDLNWISKPGDEGLHGKEMWVFTEVGEMVAMAKENRSEEMIELLASVIRTAAIHKTFQEVVDWKTGKAWRYPGQLWHAMGYISMIYYGVLGLEYNEGGLTFSNACVPKPLANLSIKALQYRKAVLNITINGWGEFSQLKIDGNPVERINPSIIGEHQVEIVLSNDSSMEGREEIYKYELTHQ